MQSILVFLQPVVCKRALPSSVTVMSKMTAAADPAA